jgi:hypothetical protein
MSADVFDYDARFFEYDWPSMKGYFADYLQSTAKV